MMLEQFYSFVDVCVEDTMLIIWANIVPCAGFHLSPAENHLRRGR